ncbi:MAG: hypothetical protein IKN49_01280 [Elusimicrobiaceae bacterium]|nr:hypothetical protein [Elusimicrobiaceae bacterium]
MNLAIPTKRDFQEDRKQAEYALLEYVALMVFPCNKESDERASRFCELWQSGSIDLHEFWGKYGEISEHEREFADFCISKIGKGEDWEQCPQAGVVSEYVSDREGKSGNEEVDAELPQEATNVDDFIGKLKEFLSSLPSSTFNKFLVFFLSTHNFIVVNAAKSPSDMPKEVQNSMPAQGGHLSYETKRLHLERLYPFWACFDRILGNKYILSDQKVQQQQYGKLYKAAHITNSSREKKKLIQIVSSFFDKFPGQFVELQEPIIQSIMRAPLQTRLQDLPKQAVSRRDQMHIILPEVFKGCSQYDKERLLLIRNEFIKTEKAPINYAYLEHRRTCAKCKQAEESMREVMEYRYGRLQEIMNKPIYPVHKPNNGQISATTPQELVQYYKERYNKIHCELHKYYLALAYKRNGKIEKAKDLLTSNDTVTLSTNSTMGTVISLYCACGKEDEYHLNALRSPKIAIGRLDEEDPLDIPQINVCQPDGLAMSRDMLTLEYQANRQDWLVHPKHEQEGNLWFLSQDKLFNLLDRQIGSVGELNIDYTESFESLTRDIWLSDIAGIGVFWEGSVLFAGQLLQGVKHPLLGRLPIGWYIEVKAQRRSKTIMKSFAEKSFVE